jgi:hypothetical protein
MKLAKHNSGIFFIKKDTGVWLNLNVIEDFVYFELS